MKHKHKSILANFDSNLWGHHFVVEKDIAEQFIEGNDRRVICTLNSELDFPCALMHYGDGNFFINLNKEIRNKLDLTIGAAIHYQLRKDTSTYGLPMPEELLELLKIDAEANKYFHSLTAGKQRSLIYIIGKPKSSSNRLNKALAICEYLKMNNGALDFRLVHEFIKNFNNLNL